MNIFIKSLSIFMFIYSIILIFIGIRNFGSVMVFSFSLLLYFSAHTNNVKIKYTLYSFFIIYLIFFLFFIIILYKNTSYENENSAKSSSFIVVLGSGLKNGNQLSKEGKKRADKAILYSKKYPHLNIFLTGGQGIDETIPESLVLKEYFLKNGVPENKIFLEDKSESTNENIKFMLETLDSKNIKVKEILLVTSDFHMPRAVIIAKYYGLSPFPLASKTRRIAFIPNIMREELAYIKTYFFDLK